MPTAIVDATLSLLLTHLKYPAMAWTDQYAHVPGVPEEHEGDAQYERDYWDAYNETWKLAWACACSGTAYGEAPSLDWTRQQAHMIALGFADVRRCLRH